MDDAGTIEAYACPVCDAGFTVEDAVMNDDHCPVCRVELESLL